MSKLVKEVKGEVKELRDKVHALEKENETLVAKVALMEKGTEKVSEQIGEVRQEVVSGMKKATEEVKKDVRLEFTEKEERAENLVLYGLEESKEKDEKKAKEEEKERIAEIASEIGVALTGEITVKFRAGKRREEGEKPRPLIVRISDDETRERLLSNARKLARSQRFSRIFIWKDLTKQQREEDQKVEKALKEEAAKKTEEAKNEGRRVKYLVVGARGRRHVVVKELERGEEEEEE